MIGYFFDCIFYTIFRWVAFLESKHLTNGANDTIFSTNFDIAFLLSMNLYATYLGATVIVDSSLASYSSEMMIICFLLAYGICYLYFIRSKRYRRIIRKMKLGSMQITLTALYIIITITTNLYISVYAVKK